MSLSLSLSSSSKSSRLASVCHPYPQQLGKQGKGHENTWQQSHLKVVAGSSLTPIGGGFAPALPALVPPPEWWAMVDSPRQNRSLNTTLGELSSALLGAIQ
ncbi:UNVERIFIED_CONTAM: hypothetical protein Sindi_1651300 [Sesamum indicum]